MSNAIIQLTLAYEHLFEIFPALAQRRDRLIKQLREENESNHNLKELQTLQRNITQQLRSMILDDRVCQRLISKRSVFKNGEIYSALKNDESEEGIFLLNYTIIFGDAMRDIGPRIKKVCRLMQTQEGKNKEDFLKIEENITTTLTGLNKLIGENYRNQFVTLARKEAPNTRGAKDIVMNENTGQNRDKSSFWVIVVIISVVLIYLRSTEREIAKIKSPNLEKKIALFDMDGTLCDFYGAMRRDLKKLQQPGEPECENPFAPGLPEYLKTRMRMIKNSPGWWERLDKLKFGFDILAEARALGYEIAILTAAPSTAINAFSEKVAWAKLHVPDAHITLTHDKGLVYGRILVDDYPTYVSAWLEHRPNGFVIMPMNQFNKDYHHPQVLIYDGTNIEKVREALREHLFP